MNIKRSVISISLLALLAYVAAGQSSDPTSVVRAFYAHDAKASQIVTRKNLDSRKKWLSPRLYNLFREEFRKESAQLKANPDDKPYFGDGFPFRPLDEPCDVSGRSYSRRYSVRLVSRSRSSRIDVPVRFSYPRPCTIEAVTYKARVVRSGSTWLIDDIVFDRGTTLSEAMRGNFN